MYTKPSTCPKTVRCLDATENEQYVMNETEETPLINEPMSIIDTEPEGIFKQWGTACDDDVYNTHIPKCHKNCTCAHCRQALNEMTLHPALSKSLHSQPGATLCHSISEVNTAANSRDALILFYSTGCPPCEAFKPVYHKVAKTASIPFYAVDAVQVPDIVNRYNLVGFPTVFKFSNGQIVAEYQGDRSENDLLLFSSSL